MNCAEKVLEPTIFFNLYTVSYKVSKGAKIRKRLFLVLQPDNNFFYSLSTFMSACRSILCPIVVLPISLAY